MKQIDFDTTDIYAFDKETLPVWADPEKWETELTSGVIVNLQTARSMTTFQAYLLEGIYETHRGREGVFRSSAWEQFEDNFMAVAMKSDYSGASFTKLTLFSMFRNDLDAQFPIKHEEFDDSHENDWAILYWPYNGEQIILKVVDDNDEPTAIAHWFFIDTNYANFFNDIEDIEDKADNYFFQKFFKEAFARTGTGINYKKLTPDTGEVIIDLPNHKGDDVNLPSIYPLPIVDFETMYDAVIYKQFKRDVDDSLVWSYKMYLRDGWNSDTNLHSLYSLLKKYDYMIIHNFTAEIEYKGHGLSVVWALRYMGLLDTSKMDFSEEYNSEEYIGDWCLHICKCFDDLVITKRRDFIDFIVKETESVNLPEGKLTYSQRMWIMINAMYESYIGD